MRETRVGSRLSHFGCRFEANPAREGLNAERGLKTVWVLALLILFSTNLPAGPTQHPKRFINTYAVDLSPLFKWWTKHDGPRPLSSWVHVTGSIAGTNAAGWILEAQVEGTDKGAKSRAGSAQEPLRIILVNPPVEDLADFKSLNSKLVALNSQRAALAAQESDDKAREQAVAEQQHAARGSRARVLANEERQLKKIENEVKAAQKLLDQQIQELKSKLAGFDSTGHYTIDCFALDLQYDHERMPVYDHGRVMK